MYAVRCPHCTRLLRLERPAQQAKMKCRNCGEIFVGSTGEYPDKAPVPGGGLGPALAPPPPPPPSAWDPAFSLEAAPPPSPDAADVLKRLKLRRTHANVFGVAMSKTALYLIGLIVGIVAIVVVVILANYYYTHPYQTMYDDRGRLVFRGRTTLEEAARRRQQAIEGIPADNLGGPSASDPTGEGTRLPRETASAPPSKPPSKGPSARPPGQPNEPPGDQEPSTPPADVDAEPLPKSDPNITLRPRPTPVTRDENENSGYLVGSLESRYDYPLNALTVDVYTHDPSGGRRSPRSADCKFIPPRGTGRFCVPYQGLKSEEVQNIRAVARAPARAAENVVAWSVEKYTRKVTDKGAIAFIGEAANPNDFTVRDVKVHYEIYDPDGILICARTGKLDNNVDRITGKGSELFTITFDPGDEGIAGDLIRDVVVRIWGTK